MSHTPDKLRNVVFMGHADSGKTSLVEAILHQTGAIGRLGAVLAGTTVTDFDPEERAKKHSIYTSVAHAKHGDIELNLIDTPGYPDFFWGETTPAASAADIACIVVNARTGVGLNTRNAWKLAERYGLARVIVINKLDADNVELEATVTAIREAFGNKCVWFRPPTGTGASYKGNSDNLADGAEGRQQIVDTAVETDEALMEKYLEQGTVSPDELARGIATGIREASLVPMVATAATAEVGVSDLIDVLVRYCPSPLEARRRRTKQGDEIDPAGPFAAHVWKVVIGDYGPQNFVRVLAGETPGHTELTNLRTGKKERIGDFQRPQGKGLEALNKLVAGDIAIIPKIDGQEPGDVLTTGATVELPEFELPEPMVTLAVSPKTRADETKLRPALDRLEREDLTFTTTRNDETKELLIKGMSTLHLETLLERMKERTKVEVERRLPKIAYRETIRGKAEATYAHKKQSGGAGEYGKVSIRLAPTAHGEGFKFANKVVGGAISASFVPAVEKGIQEAMEEGVVAGYRFVDCEVELFDGKEHPVDSKEVAFKKAGRGAFREAVQNARPVLLEPIMQVEITVPEQFTGDIMGDLARRRSHPQGMEQTEAGTVIKALVPEAEMQTYSQELRAMTSGEGVFAMKFDHYDFLPPDKAQPLIDAHAKEKAEGHNHHH